MPPLDEYALSSKQIETGMLVLKKRQHKVMLLCVTTSTLFIASVVAIFLQQDFIYSFFGLSQKVEQLHLPLTLEASLTDLAPQHDYFFNLLSWFGWLFLKLFAAFFGAFFTVYFLRKFHFFYIRFQSFILKFVGWLIAFIIIWSGLTYVQYDLNNEEKEAAHELVYYERNIQDSAIAHYLAEENVEKPVQAYILAQTALLHQPADKNTAIPYIVELVKAEKTDPDFIEYGFKPEQLWVMQHQVYGKALTPLAQSVEPQVRQAQQLSYWANIIIIAISLLSAVLSLIFYLLSHRLQLRTERITHRLNS